MTDVAIAAMKAKAEGWGSDNPFKAPLPDRLAKLGGLHRTPPTDTGTGVEEALIDQAREAAEAISEPVCIPRPFNAAKRSLPFRSLVESSAREL